MSEKRFTVSKMRSTKRIEVYKTADSSPHETVSVTIIDLGVDHDHVVTVVGHNVTEWEVRQLAQEEYDATVR